MAGWPSTPGDQLIRLFRGFWLSRAIYVAVELGIADLLEEGPRSVTDLATATATHPPSLYRVMRLLASEGVFLEADDGRFELTPMAKALRTCSLLLRDGVATSSTPGLEPAINLKFCPVFS